MPSFSCHREITWIPEFNLAIKKHCHSSMWWKICPLHGHGLALSRYSKHNWKMNSLRDSKMNIILPCPPVAWVQFSSVTQLCPTLCNPMNCSMPGLPVHHRLPEFTQTHVHWVGDAIQSSRPLLSHSPPAPNPSQHQSLFQWVNSSHEVAKVLEFQL